MCSKRELKDELAVLRREVADLKARLAVAERKQPVVLPATVPSYPAYPYHPFGWYPIRSGTITATFSSGNCSNKEQPQTFTINGFGGIPARTVTAR